MWQQIGKLFTTTQIIPVLVIVLGLVLCVWEICKSQFSSKGIIGGVLIMGSMIAVMMLKGTIAQFLFLLFVILIVIVLAFCLVTLLFDKTVFFKKPKKGEEVVEVDEEATLSKLVGKIGVAQTELNLEGKVLVSGVTLDAVSKTKIEKGAEIKIVKINGIKIVVEGTEVDE